MSQQQSPIGLLLVNLGTPDSPSRADVRRYLKEFLSDPRVVEGSRLAWWLVLNGIILNTRPKKSAAAYQKIWTSGGSPLLYFSQRQRDALQQQLGEQIKVVMAMRYGNPSIAQGLNELKQAGCSRILLFSLYPQYSATTTGSVFDAVSTELQQWRWIPELRMINQYYDHPGYISALADSVRAFQKENGPTDRLLMSFHGLPKSYTEAGDPYAIQCQQTATLLGDALALEASQWLLTYQSRVGPREWLQPYTDETLKQLPGQGIKKIQVICPGFAVDCLETLEEIAMQNRDTFLAAGGETYDYIPCLNDNPAHIEILTKLIRQYLGGWTDR
jgi:ferrochelatase